MLPVVHRHLLEPLLAQQVVFDVVASLGPSVVASVALASLNNGPAEAAPEASVGVSAETTGIHHSLSLVSVGEPVDELEVGLEAFPAEAEGAAAGLATQPRVAGPMLAALVALPVVFAAESLAAAGKGASVGFLVPLHVFPARRHRGVRDGNGWRGGGIGTRTGVRTGG